MDIILGAAGIGLMWLLMSVLSMIALAAILCGYENVTKKESEILHDNKKMSQAALVIGALITLALFAKRGGFL
jgi:hypothetical protein